MNTTLLRKIDYYLGPAVCRLLLGVRGLLVPGYMTENSQCLKECKNVLIVKFFGMGTILLFSPALRQLKKKFPGARISIVTLVVNRELCQMLPSIDEVFCLDIRGPARFLKSFFAFLREVQRCDFDVVIDLEFLTNFSALVSLLVTLLDRPKVAIGFNAPFKWRNDIYHINVAFDHSRHITKIFAKLISSLTGERFEPSFAPERDLLLEKMDLSVAEDKFGVSRDLGGHRATICVNINAGELNFNRRWPREHFAEVVKRLLARPEVTVALIGGKEDAGYVSHFVKTVGPSPRLVDLTGTTTLKQLVGIFSRAQLLITNDSGPLHLAEVLGLPTISFFGPETPYLYGPLDSHHYVFYRDSYCSPCLNIYNSKISRCTNNVCLSGIQPAEVMRVIEESYLVSGASPAASRS